MLDARAPSADFHPIPPDPQTVFAAANLVTAVRRLADRLEDATGQLHAGDSLTVAERGLLLLLRQGGVQTIPQLAARRGTSRQYIQQALSPLVARGLVAWRDNPRHRRSRLAELSGEGAALARRVMAREGQMLGILAAAVERSRMTDAAGALRVFTEALRAALEVEPAVSDGSTTPLRAEAEG